MGTVTNGAAREPVDRLGQAAESPRRAGALAAPAQRDHDGQMTESQTHGVGEVFLDARGQGRAMRLTWHHEAGVVVLSLWRGDVCAGTFRLAMGDVNDFIDALVEGLRDAPGVSIDRPIEPNTGSHPQPMPPQRALGGEAFADWAFREPAHRATAS